ncbi:uncharacterized protein LTR77_001903 [Saxophila tyrrhenica]|uniref:Glycosyltransferase family 8 protein n=1 Tax=Saxophila tyrrhenica TaxID=1690608 RepID=A0AAV9PLJ1_9PEZI|nr:hypothetical protein LTR77_001903 [Saxophila tyrrhenica]
MGRILLTQSQATVVLTFGLIAIFTLLLFLAGYVHQQQTVTGLQTALKPRLPKPPPSAATIDNKEHAQQPLYHPSRILGSRSKNGGHIAYTDFTASTQDEAAKINWSRLAHVQIVRNHHDMCNAIMVLADLHRLKSPARRVLMFPQAWATEKKAGRGDVSDPFLDISRRLMKVAARRYGVELRPISPFLQVGEEQSSYSLASAFAFTEFDRVMTIETPGLILDAEPLDAILAFTEPAPFAMLHDTVDEDGVHEDDIFLMQPSNEIYQALRDTLADQSSFNDTLLPATFPDPLLISTSSPSQTLIRSIGLLHDAPITSSSSSEPSFNATAFLSEVAYMRFSDPKLPGPEYEVPWARKVAARPKNKDADWTWTKLYGEFEMKRMEVCGLGLEVWRQ